MDCKLYDALNAYHHSQPQSCPAAQDHDHKPSSLYPQSIRRPPPTLHTIAHAHTANARTDHSRVRAPALPHRRGELRDASSMSHGGGRDAVLVLAYPHETRLREGLRAPEVPAEGVEEGWEERGRGRGWRWGAVRAAKHDSDFRKTGWGRGR